MKLNRFRCDCGHEWYDSSVESTCDSCGASVGLKPVDRDVKLDIRLVERLDAFGNNASKLREAISRLSETSSTHKKMRSNET